MTRYPAHLRAPGHGPPPGKASGSGPCIAQPPQHVRRYRGWDHRNYHHPTPSLARYRRCAGDYACAVRLLIRDDRRVCPDHEDLARVAPAAERYEELMGAKPARPSAVHVVA